MYDAKLSLSFFYENNIHGFVSLVHCVMALSFMGDYESRHMLFKRLAHLYEDREFLCNGLKYVIWMHVFFIFNLCSIKFYDAGVR